MSAATTPAARSKGFPSSSSGALSLSPLPSPSSAPEWSVPELFSPVRNGCWADEMDFEDGIYHPLEATAAPPRASGSLPTARSGEATPGLPLFVHTPYALTVGPAFLPLPSPVEPQSRDLPAPQRCGSVEVGLAPRCAPALLEVSLSDLRRSGRGGSPALSASSGLSSSYGSSRSSTPPPMFLGSPEELPCGGDPAAEAALAEIFARLLQDPAMNPHNGSVSLEKLRHFAREEAPELYVAAVGPEDAQFPWKTFLRRHRDRLRKVPGTTRRIKVYLTGNPTWKQNDEWLKAGVDFRDHQFLGPDTFASRMC